MTAAHWLVWRWGPDLASRLYRSSLNVSAVGKSSLAGYILSNIMEPFIDTVACSQCSIIYQNTRNGIVQPLLTDLYQITMAYAYWKSGRVKDSAVFDMFFRRNPFDGEFTIFAGLEECLKFLQNFKYSDSG